MSRTMRWVGSVFALAVGLTAAAGHVAAQTQNYTILSLLDYSGPFANRGKPVEQMQRLLVDEFNETRGAKLGIKLDYKPVDTGYDQAKTVQAYERALEDKALVGIVTFGSPNVIALQNRLSQDKVPAVHGGPSYSLMKPGNWVFTPLGDYARYYASAVKWRLANWKESRPLRIAFVTFDGSSGRDWAQGLQGLLKGMNVELVLTEFVSPRALDVSANVSHVIDAKPDLVFLATTDQLQPALLKELKANKFDMTKVVNSQHEGLGLLELLGVPKDAYEGTYEVTSENYADQTSPAYKIYAGRQAKYSTRWSADTLLHFPSMMVLLDAIDRAQTKAGKGRITGEDVFAQMRAGSFDGYGLLGKIQFDIDKDPTQGADAVIMLQQKDGKISKASDFMPLVK
jgi:branched-chain amino acid transport system substrate-binding protein